VFAQKHYRRVKLQPLSGWNILLKSLQSTLCTVLATVNLTLLLAISWKVSECTCPQVIDRKTENLEVDFFGPTVQCCISRHRNHHIMTSRDSSALRQKRHSNFTNCKDVCNLLGYPKDKNKSKENFKVFRVIIGGYWDARVKSYCFETFGKSLTAFY